MCFATKQYSNIGSLKSVAPCNRWISMLNVDIKQIQFDIKHSLLNNQRCTPIHCIKMVTLVIPLCTVIFFIDVQSQCILRTTRTLIYQTETSSTFFLATASAAKFSSELLTILTQVMIICGNPVIWKFGVASCRHEESIMSRTVAVESHCYKYCTWC